MHNLIYIVCSLQTYGPGMIPAEGTRRPSVHCPPSPSVIQLRYTTMMTPKNAVVGYVYITYIHNEPQSMPYGDATKSSLSKNSTYIVMQNVPKFHCSSTMSYMNGIGQVSILLPAP